MSDRLIGQPAGDNTADHESGRGEAAAPQHGETGDDMPDQGDPDSGARPGPGEGSGDAERTSPDERADSGGAGPRDRRAAASAKGRRHRSFWRELPLLIITALVIALLIKTFVAQAFFIPSGSMRTPWSLRQDPGQQARLSLQEHSARRHRRVQRRGLLDPGPAAVAATPTRSSGPTT